MEAIEMEFNCGDFLPGKCEISVFLSFLFPFLKLGPAQGLAPRRGGRGRHGWSLRLSSMGPKFPQGGLPQSSSTALRLWHGTTRPATYDRGRCEAGYACDDPVAGYTPQRP